MHLLSVTMVAIYPDARAMCEALQVLNLDRGLGNLTEMGIS
ncbi:MAG: hypothetical protein R6U70_00505 [Bacillota bacterium]